MLNTNYNRLVSLSGYKSGLQIRGTYEHESSISPNNGTSGMQQMADVAKLSQVLFS
jgi:hypothetical protein